MNSYNITFPIKDDNDTNGFIKTNKITKDSYSSNLLLLLLTQKGERYYDPNYGTDLTKYIFEPNDSLTAGDVENEIRNTVSLYIPEIKVSRVSFNWNNDDNGIPIPENQLNVNIKFTYTDGSLSEDGNLDLNF